MDTATVGTHRSSGGSGTNFNFHVESSTRSINTKEVVETILDGVLSARNNWPDKRLFSIDSIGARSQPKSISKQFDINIDLMRLSVDADEASLSYIKVSGVLAKNREGWDEPLIRLVVHGA